MSLFSNPHRANKSDVLKCTLINARSICNKLPELYYLLYANDYDILLFTESWLNTNIPDSLLDPENKYALFRCDRINSTGGGVCAFVAKHLTAVEVNLTDSFPNVEMCCFDMHCNQAQYRLFTIYRPLTATKSLT